jgi:hypothetical protein
MREFSRTASSAGWLPGGRGADGVDGTARATRIPDLIVLDMQMPTERHPGPDGSARRRPRRYPRHHDDRRGPEAIAVRACMGATTSPPFTDDEMLMVVRACRRRAPPARDRPQRPAHPGAQQQLERQLQELNTLYIGKQAARCSTCSSTGWSRPLCSWPIEEGLLLLDEQTGELYVRAAKNLDDRVAHRCACGPPTAWREGADVRRAGHHRRRQGVDPDRLPVKAILYVRCSKGRTIGVLGSTTSSPTGFPAARPAPAGGPGRLRRDRDRERPAVQRERGREAQVRGDSARDRRRGAGGRRRGPPAAVQPGRRADSSSCPSR